jgi:hypothetical protein
MYNGKLCQTIGYHHYAFQDGNPKYQFCDTEVGIRIYWSTTQIGYLYGMRL